MAIYQDMGMLPSIGEVTADTGALHGNLFNDADEWTPYTAEGIGSATGKPGTYANLQTTEVKITVPHWLLDEVERDVTVVDSADLEYTAGWASYGDRNGFSPSPFFRKYDEWDQLTLRKSARVLKKLFKIHYRKREWGAGESDENNELVQQKLAQLRERFRISPGAAFVPWWKKNRIRSNPFNAEGELCKKKD
jgi:hypothetical protein